VVINSQTFHTGVELETGDTLEGRKYDLRIDERPDELYEEFLNEYDLMRRPFSRMPRSS
jgi:hypothetical protein